MQETAVSSPALTPDERALLADLLEHESRQLAVEIRRTDLRIMRASLHRRLELVDHLLASLNARFPESQEEQSLEAHNG